MSERTPRVIFAEDVPQQDFRPVAWQICMNGSESGMNCYYSAHWNNVKEREPETGGPRKVGHPPHMHKENEIIMLIGMNPEDPYDLGATVEFCCGPNMEKHTFTRSVTIMVPGGTPHGFYRTVECHRPFYFVSVQEAVNRTEKFLWEYLTPEEIAAIPHPEKWVDVGYDD